MKTIGKCKALQELNSEKNLTLYSVDVSVYNGKNLDEVISVLIGAASAILAMVWAIDYSIKHHKVKRRRTFSAAVGIAN